jgi:hypothetical protein
MKFALGVIEGDEAYERMLVVLNEVAGDGPPRAR